MNKTISMNVGGVVFQVDEDAFEGLRAYLLRIEGNLGAMAGSGEIIADIEARIAELLQERLKEGGREAVSREDVGRVIDILGQPEDYVDEGAAQGDDGQHKARGRRSMRKLYRDPEHKTIAGVASGLAAYSGIHTAWVRILFVVLCFVTSGSTLLLYALLWICVPYAKTTSEKLEMRGEPVNFDSIKRNFRDTTAQLKAKLSEDPTFFEKLLSDAGRLSRILLRGIGYFVTLVLLLAAAISLSVGLLSAIGILNWGWNTMGVGPAFGPWSRSLFPHHVHHDQLLLIYPLWLGIFLLGLVVTLWGLTRAKKTDDQARHAGWVGLLVLLFMVFLLLLWHLSH